MLAKLGHILVFYSAAQVCLWRKSQIIVCIVEFSSIFAEVRGPSIAADVYMKWLQRCVTVQTITGIKPFLRVENLPDGKKSVNVTREMIRNRNIW